MEIDDKYEEYCNASIVNNIGNDIRGHLPTLKYYASISRHVTEFGIRGGTSTVALIAGRPSYYRGYDVHDCECVSYLRCKAKEVGVDFKFCKADDLQVEIDPTDFLFIDTLHFYDQLHNELLIHSNKVANYIVIHDTATFAEQGHDNFHPEQPGLRGMRSAIEDFIKIRPEWQVFQKYENDNGLTILKRS